MNKKIINIASALAASLTIGTAALPIVTASACVFPSYNPCVPVTTLDGNQTLSTNLTISSGHKLVIGNDFILNNGATLTIEKGATLEVKGKLQLIEKSSINNSGYINSRWLCVFGYSTVNNSSLIESNSTGFYDPDIAGDGDLYNLNGGITRFRKTNPQIDYMRYSIKVNPDFFNDYIFEDAVTGQKTTLSTDNGFILLLKSPSLFGHKGWIYQIDGNRRGFNATGVKEWIDIPKHENFPVINPFENVKFSGNTLTGLNPNLTYHIDLYDTVGGSSALHEPNPRITVDLKKGLTNYQCVSQGYYEVTATYEDGSVPVIFTDTFSFAK
ncbi:MAG: hypothetical protein LBT37_00590 [Lactobacillaceae bacterium]|jgi:hypothetical protein|nr:hypothetical protein [Lactobacillaceae bacterium]